MNEDITWREPTTAATEQIATGHVAPTRALPQDTAESPSPTSDVSAPRSSTVPGAATVDQTGRPDETEPVEPSTDVAGVAGSEARVHEHRVRHAQVIIGVVALAASAALALFALTDIFSNALTWPVIVLVLGVFVLVYGMAALRGSRPLSPAKERRREQRALARITRHERRRARRADSRPRRRERPSRHR